MNETGDCPDCGKSWQGEPIPEKDREHFGDKTHFSLLIGIEHRRHYDGVAVFVCPFCKTEFRPQRTAPKEASSWRTTRAVTRK